MTDQSESLVLGCLIQGYEPSTPLQESQFSNHYHKILYNTITRIRTSGKQVTLVSVYDELVKLKYESLGGGIAGLASLTNLPSDVHPKDLLDRLVTEFKANRTYRQYGATSLDTEVSDEKVKSVKSKLWVKKTVIDKETGQEKEMLVLSLDWYRQVIDLDPEIANCLKYDYTTGNPVVAYHNTDILEAALQRRLEQYVPIQYIKPKNIDYIISQVKHRNQNYNRVASFIDELKDRYDPIDNPLDEFMKCFKFMEVKDYDKSDVCRIYTELFHLYFLRMHIHINGTRMLPNNEYVGLIPNDMVPILVGGQGIGKTTFTQWVACSFNRPDMYVGIGSGQKGQFGDEETVRKVRGRLIAELGEMRVMRRADDVEVVKDFISKDKYDVNVKYVEYAKPIPATVSYVGTSNQVENLSDETGNRRFWPVLLQDIDLDFISKNHVLMESLHAYYARLAESTPHNDRLEVLKPSKDLHQLMEALRDNSIIEHPDVGAVMEVIDKAYEDLKASGKSKHTVKRHEIEKMVHDAGYRCIISRSGVTRAMTKLGYEYKATWDKGITSKAWIKDIKPDQPNLLSTEMVVVDTI